MSGVTEVDVIILSYAMEEKFQRLTKHCIGSLLSSEPEKNITFNILVCESQNSVEEYHYPFTKTLYPAESFSHNHFFNKGMAVSNSKYVCLCHNDIIFHRHWATEILKSFDRYPDLSSASPFCPIHHPLRGFEGNSGTYNGYRCGFEISPWCIFVKRDLFRLYGLLDVNYKFWCAENDYAYTLSVLKLRHSLVTSAWVEHKHGGTAQAVLNSSPKLTNDEFFYFEKKWHHRL